MPNYEYRCHNCGKVTEQVRRVEDRYNWIPCENCRAEMDGGNLIMSLSHFTFPGGLPSYENDVNMEGFQQ